MEFPRHGFKVLDGGKVDATITLSRAEWIDVLDELLEARDTNRVYGRNYSSVINSWHRKRAERCQELFDKINKGLSQ